MNMLQSHSGRLHAPCKRETKVLVRSNRTWSSIDTRQLKSIKSSFDGSLPLELRNRQKRMRKEYQVHLPIRRWQHLLSCRYRIAASTSVLQTDGVGSIPTTCSN